jgi:Sec-independent protein secretion pathway component TatC
VTVDGGRFARVAAGLVVVVFVVDAVAAPPDPYTQLLVLGPGVAGALLVAALVASRCDADGG